MLWQPSLPDRYQTMAEDEVAKAIRVQRDTLGSKVIILGHHYQQDDVIRHADFDGDSFKLSQLAADQVKATGAKYIIFCGVHFMAESADILTPEDVAVILPDLSAGCSMADMADYDQTCTAWDEIHEALAATGVAATTRVIPITYMNSSAAIKAFVGEHGGAVCTSSNADTVFEWALAGGNKPLKDGETIKILFLPDQHLGRNTAHAAGFVTEIDAKRTGQTAETAIWDPAEEFGGLTFDAIRDCTILLWKGHCSVHMLFRSEHITEQRKNDPDVRIVVHPECCQEVVDAADETGSTGYILKVLNAAEPGSHWAVGTEVHLVNRMTETLAKRDIKVESLSGCQCLCTTMYRISPERLLWVLDNLVEVESGTSSKGHINNQIVVHPEISEWAEVALERMLSLVGQKGDSAPEQKVVKTESAHSG